MENGTLIKATQLLERLSIDFKGPVPSISNNVFIITIVDEYSRFPFAFPFTNMHTSMVMNCLDQLFALTGLPGYIHSDRGTSFLSKEMKTYLLNRGIATSKTTSYHSDRGVV